MRPALLLALLAACSQSPRPAAPAPAPGPAAPAPAPKIDLLDLYARWNSAANASDWTAMAALYAPDAQVTAASTGSTLSGRDSIVELFKSFRGGFPDLTSRPTLFVEDGRRLIAVSYATGTNTVPLGAMPATRKPIGFFELAVIEVNEAGAIARQMLYADNLNFMGQLGLWDGKSRPVEPAPAGEAARARAGTGAAESDNAALVRTAAALFGAHDAAGLQRLYTADAVLDDVSAAAPAAGPAIEKAYQELFAAFPDVSITDLQVTAAGDHVVATYRMTGTHGGPWPRLRAPAGTMRQIDLEAAALFQVRDGKIVRHTIFVDGLAAAMQLGLYQIPGDEPPKDFKPPAS